MGEEPLVTPEFSETTSPDAVPVEPAIEKLVESRSVEKHPEVFVGTADSKAVIPVTLVTPVSVVGNIAAGPPPSAVPVEIERVPIEAALAAGWQLMKKNILLLMAISILAGLLMAVPGFVYGLIKDLVSRNYFLMACLAICFITVPPIYYLGRIKVSLRFRRSEPFTSDDFVNVFPMFFHFVLMVVCRSVLLFFSYLAFFIPGIIVQARLEYADYFIIDKRENAFKAMASSWRITKNSTMMLILFGVTCHFVETLGVLALFIGMVPAKWMTLIARSYVYDRLCETASSEGVAVDVSPVVSYVTTTSGARENSAASTELPFEHSVEPPAEPPAELPPQSPENSHPPSGAESPTGLAPESNEESSSGQP